MIDNTTIYEARLHWILFIWPAALFFLMLYVSETVVSLKPFAMILEIVAVLWGAATWMIYHFSSFVIKKKHVILRTGILVQRTIDIPLNKIESIDIRQSVLGSLLQYGSLIVTGTGGTRQFINYLAKPLTCRRYIEQFMHGE